MSTLSRERPFLQSTIAIISALSLGVGGLFFGFILASIAVFVFTVVTGAQPSATEQIVIILVFIQGIGCAGIALSYHRLRPTITPRIRSALNLSADSRPFVIPAAVPDARQTVTIVGGYLTALGGVIVGSALIGVVQSYTGTNLESGTNQAAEIGIQNPETLLLLIPASILIIGPGEELLFRGVVQGRLREVFGPVPGIAIPSIVFAGLHWFAISGGSIGGNIASLSLIAVLAGVLGVTYEYTDNIVVPAMIHGLYNATLFSLLYVVVAYGDQMPQ